MGGSPGELSEELFSRYNNINDCMLLLSVELFSRYNNINGCLSDSSIPSPNLWSKEHEISKVCPSML